MAVDAGPQLVDGDHVVQFYADEHELVSMVAGYLSAAVSDGDAVIVIATADHRNAFEPALADRDVELARQEGRLVVLDAADALSTFMVGDLPDPAAFDDFIGGVVRAAAADGTPVRAYGEMVSLLWEAGHVAGAIELERLWNALGERTPFALFCAYPAHLMSNAAASAHRSVCQLHSDVLVGAPNLAGREAVRRFPRSPMSSLHARRFVADTLTGWGHPRLVDDAVLVVAELVANAVTHAESDLTVGLSRIADGVRLEVADTSRAFPERRPGRPTDIGGRGVILLDAIARRWGHDMVDGGKVVWVDLARAETA